jgi:hypothetical protein
LPARWCFEPGNQPQAGGLTGTGRAKHGKEAALGNRQIDSVDGADGAEMARDIGEFNGWDHGFFGQ